MTNPKTCLHNVVEARITEGLELVVYCLSCGTDVPPEMRVGKNYKYDYANAVWVHTPGS